MKNNMTYKDKLTELLKTVPEIKKDLEELRFWCSFKYENQWDNEILTFCSIYEDTWWTLTLSFLIPNKERTDEINSFSDDDLINLIKIIWNPIQYHNLEQYCVSKHIKLIRQANWVLKEISWESFETETSEIITNLDNIKSFNNQEDKVYEDLFNYLTK